MISKKKIFLINTLIIINIIMMILLAYKFYGIGNKHNNLSTKQEVDDVRDKEDDINLNSQVVDFVSEEEEQCVSVFSWHFELTNQALFGELVQPLIDLKVDRVYQNVSAGIMKEPATEMMVRRLIDSGIEVVPLMGDKSWINDGLKEFHNVVDAIAEYNANMAEGYQIKRIALDVEVHTLPEWKEKSMQLFEEYSSIMKAAREYANSHELEVVQIIPTTYDEVVGAQFKGFLKDCCDEISVMNYVRSNAYSAIADEVNLCRELKIPIETIFETMPVSEEYKVTEEMTYFDLGMECLLNDREKMRLIFGTDLGVAYHHYTSLYKLYSDHKLCEIYYDEWNQGNETNNPGNLLLYGDDGSEVLATPYWPGGKRKQDGEFCWLAIGLKENVTYNIYYTDLYQNVLIEKGFSITDSESEKLEIIIGTD